MPRFVILEHDWPHRHWDLMFESGDTLRTWRLAAPPPANGAVAATPLPAHRKIYLNYEGPLSNKRGSVKRWDAGWYEPIQTEPIVWTKLRVHLHGRRFVGTADYEAGADGACRFYFDGVLSETETTGNS